MPIRRWIWCILALTIWVVWPHARVAAQSTIADRARKAAQDAANAGKKAVSDEANRQVNSAVQDAATENVADGSFIAVLSPWSSSDGTKRVEVARFSGAAFVATTPTGRQIIVCDTKGVLAWQSTLTILNTAAAPAGARGAAGTAGRGSGAAPARSGGAPAGGTSSTTDTSAASGGPGSSGASSTAAPSAGEQKYRLPSSGIVIALPTTGAKSGNPSQGLVTIGNVSETILTGTAKVRFSQATIPTDKGPQVVDLGIAFKARVLAPGAAPDGCMSPTAGKTTTATKTPATPTQTAPATTTAPAPGATFAEGDVLIPKIDNVKLLGAAMDTAAVTATLKISDQLVYLGDEQNGYLHVQGASGEGWVRKALLKKH